MTVIAAFLYRNGQRVRPVAIDERINCAADKSEFVWIGVADPTVEEMQTLARTYNLHPLAVEDAIKANLYRMRRAIAHGVPGLETLIGR